MEPTYTAKEVFDIQLRSLTEAINRLDKTLNNELLEVKNLIKDQNAQIEKRSALTDGRFEKIDIDIQKMRTEIQSIKEENAGYKKIWGIGATAGASMIALLSAYVFNRIF